MTSLLSKSATVFNMKTRDNPLTCRTDIPVRLPQQSPKSTDRNVRPTAAFLAMIATCFALFSGYSAESDARKQLQEGLFEEEVNRDLKSAMNHYLALLDAYDANRKIAATAVIRLGECYRKLGRNDEAVSLFKRVTREFGEITNLVATATTRLRQLGTTIDVPTPKSPDGLDRLERIFSEVDKLTAERAEIEIQDDLLQELDGTESMLTIETTLKDSVLSNLFTQIRVLAPNLQARFADGLTEEKLQAELGPTNWTKFLDLNAHMAIRIEYLKEWVDLREEVLDSKLETYQELIPLLIKTSQATELISTSSDNPLAELPDVLGKLAALESADESTILSLAQELKDPQLDALVSRWTNLLTLPERRMIANQEDLKFRRYVGEKRYAESQAIRRQLDVRVQTITAQLKLRQSQLTEIAGARQTTSRTSPKPPAVVVRLGAELESIDTKLAELEKLSVFYAKTLDDTYSPKLINEMYRDVQISNVLADLIAILPQDEWLEFDNLNTPQRKEKLGENYEAFMKLADHLESRTDAVEESNRRQIASLRNRRQILTDTIARSSSSTKGKPSSPEEIEIAEISKRLQTSPDLLSANYKNCGSPLEYAVTNEYASMVSYLLKEGAQTGQPNQSGSPPLVLAVFTGNLTVTKALIAAGAGKDTNNLNLALSAAASRGFLTLIRFLLNEGGDPNASIAGPTKSYYSHPAEATALIGAIRSGQLRATELLLNSGADPNRIGREGLTPVHIAANANLIDRATFVRLLVKHGANLNTLYRTAQSPSRNVVRSEPSPSSNARAVAPEFQTILHVSARNGDVDMIKALLEMGADPNVRDSNEATPLLVAVGDGEYWAAKALLEHGVDTTLAGYPEKTVQRLGRVLVTPLTFLLFESDDHPRQLELAKLMLKQGADPNAQLPVKDLGNTLLIRNLYNGKRATAKLLLEHGAKPDGTIQSPSRSALTIALGREYRELIQPLLDAGADANRQSGGNFPLLEAVEESDTESVSKLLAAGADPNQASSDTGFTCLDFIARTQTGKNHSELEQIRKQLINAGATPVASHPRAITVIRRNPAAKWPILMYSNHVHSSFTLLEAIALTYRHDHSTRDSVFRFPDFDRVLVHRPDATGYDEKTINVNDIVTDTNKSDFKLEWGDVIEIPIRPHKVNASWKLNDDFQTALAQRLARTVTLRYNDVDGPLPLLPLPASKKFRDVKIFIATNRLRCVENYAGSMETSVKSCWLGQVTSEISDLMTWNDLSKVRVSRKSPSGGDFEQLTFDLTPQPSADSGFRMATGRTLEGNPMGSAVGLWLQDGDIIEIPKGDPNTMKQSPPRNPYPIVRPASIRPTRTRSIPPLPTRR